MQNDMNFDRNHPAASNRRSWGTPPWSPSNASNGPHRAGRFRPINHRRPRVSPSFQGRQPGAPVFVGNQQNQQRRPGQKSSISPTSFYGNRHLPQPPVSTPHSNPPAVPQASHRASCPNLGGVREIHYRSGQTQLRISPPKSPRRERGEEEEASGELRRTRDAEPLRENRPPGPAGRAPTSPPEAAVGDLLPSITSHADMSNQQRIEMIRMAVKLGDEYLLCLLGHAQNERQFWRECSTLALGNYGLDFATPSIMKAGVKAICKSRLKQKTDGTLHPGLDELHKTIDKWNEIVIQREQQQFARQEATHLSMRWAKVPDETRALSQRKLEEYWRTLEDPASNAEELKVANFRVAVLLSPDLPQLTARFAEKMAGQMQSRRRDAENLVNDTDQIVITLPDMHDGRDRAESRASSRFRTPRYARSSATIPSPASSGLFVTQDNTPQPSETPSPSLKRKRRDESDSPRKKKKKRSRHRPASRGDHGEEEQTPSDDEALQSVAVELPVPVLPSVEGTRDSDSPPRLRKQKRRRNVLPESSSPYCTSSGTPASTSRKAPREDRRTAGDLDREQVPVTTPVPSSLSGSRSRSKSQSSRPRRKSHNSRSRNESQNEPWSKSRSKSIGTDAGFHSQSSIVLGGSRAGRARSRASTLPQSPPPSSPSSTTSDESSDPRFTRAPTDYETETMRSIVSRHKQESKDACKQLRKKCHTIGLKTEDFQTRLGDLEDYVAAQYPKT